MQDNFNTTQIIILTERSKDRSTKLSPRRPTNLHYEGKKCMGKGRDGESGRKSRNLPGPLAIKLGNGRVVTFVLESADTLHGRQLSPPGKAS